LEVLGGHLAAGPGVATAVVIEDRGEEDEEIESEAGGEERGGERGEVEEAGGADGGAKLCEGGHDGEGEGEAG
jgi:hypothetical protein